MDFAWNKDEDLGMSAPIKKCKKKNKYWTFPLMLPCCPHNYS